MPSYGIPGRSPTPRVNDVAPVRWRRGLFRMWLLLTFGWIMSWAIHLIMRGLQGRFTRIDFLVIPIILFGPPVALLIFSIVARWAVRGFRVEHSITT
jgi:hypothetical protein